MPRHVSIDQLKALQGRSLGSSDWMCIDQARINAFANATEDRQFIHTDPDAAKPLFGGTIAHGFLTLSLLTHLTSELIPLPDNVVMGINYGFDKIRFLQAVPVDSEIRATAKLLKLTMKGTGQALLKTEIGIEIRGSDRPALVADWLTLIQTG
ncbi:MAG: MaoC family dehydratase [Gammaproteobacteria bacterium]|nr:MaoC family dehydratase [Gammaproteobacteria bacterium]